MPQKVTVTCSSAATIDLDEFVPFQGELKTLSDSSYQRLKASILKYGVSFPFYVWEHRGKKYGIDGHQRDRVLRHMRDKEGYEIPPLPVDFIQARNRREAKEKILLISSQYGKMTEESLHDFLAEAEISLDAIKDLIDLPQIDLEHFEAGWAQEAGEGVEDPADAVPEPEGEPITAPGDVWVMDDHKVLCGDSTDVNVVKSFLDRQPEVVFSDPPYGISIVKSSAGAPGQDHDGKIERVPKGKVGGGGETKFGKVGGGKWVPANTYREIKGDESPDAAKRFYESCRMLGMKKFILWGGHYFSEFLPPSGRWVVWDKETGESNFGDCELAWTSYTGAVRLYKWRWAGLLRQGGRDEELVRRIHPTQKPVGLFKQIFEDFPFEVCLDGFLGSGSTLIACEQTGRVCYGVEIEPVYVDVVCQRWMDLTGKSPVREKDGQDFSQLKRDANTG